MPRFPSFRRTAARLPLIPGALGFLLILGAHLVPARAAGIGVNFTGDVGGAGTNMAPALSAGVVPRANWNNMAALPNQGLPVVLTDESGAASGASLTWSSNNTWRSANNAASQPLMDGYIDSSAANPTITVTLSGIPFGVYEVYVYVGSDGDGRTGRTRINDNPATDIWHITTTSTFGGFSEGTATTESAAFPSNYARYSGLSGSSLTVQTLRGSNNFGLHGIQIVETTPSGAPTVDNLPAQNITANACRIRGTLVAPGTTTPTVRIYWGPTDGGTSIAAWQNVTDLGALATPQNFQSDISALSSGTTHFFRTFAVNAQGEVWAPQSASFITAFAPPSVENIAATGIEAFSAKIGALVTATGGENPSVTLYYGPNDAGTDAAGWQHSTPLGILSAGNSGVTTISGLTAATSYFVRARATHTGGTGWAEASATFTTADLALPAVANDPATIITGVSARLNGRVIDTGGDPPAVTFYFGTSDGGSLKDNWATFVQLGPNSGAFSRTVANLAPLSTYYFRALATNGAGEIWASPSLSFQTPAFVAPSIVINEIHYDESDKTSKSEFIELYNNSQATVDLSGWYFSSGVKSPIGDFILANGTTLPSGAYLVVAQNPAALQAKFGYSGALGPWSGKLSNSSEKITLRNAAGDVIDEVEYKLGFPWPTVGDPPDPSIDLINPDLDNTLGGSWRASSATPGTPTTALITAASSWKYFKGTTEPSSPQSAWRQLAFDDSTWLTGTTPTGYGENFLTTTLADMSGGYSTVYFRKTFTVTDPSSISSLLLRGLVDDGINVWINGSHVASLNVGSENIAHTGTASGAIENPNFVDFPLTGVSSHLVAGTNVIAVQLLNSNLAASSDAFFDADLTPVTGGGNGPTPGARNASFASDAAPALRQVNHSPKQPSAGQAVTITVKATDPGGVSSVSLDYQIVEPGDYIKITDPRYQTSWTTLPMRDDGTNGDALAGDDIFSTVIPASVQAHRRLVRYRLTATDSATHSVTAPYADDPQPNFAYFVYNGIPDYTGKATPTSPDVTYNFNTLPPLQRKVSVYQLITTRNDHVSAQSIPNSSTGQYGGSDYLWQGTLVYDGVVYDHIRFRARGGVWRYAMGKNMWKFDFNRGHRLEARDSLGKEYPHSWSKLNFSSLIQQGDFQQRGEQGLFEGAGFRLHNLAGNAAPNTHFVHFRIIEGTSENGTPGNQFDTDFQGLYLAVEQMDGQFLDQHKLPDGNLYKMEGGTGELNNQGPDQPKNKSDLNAFLSAYTGDATQPEAWWRTNVNLDDYYNFRAIATFIHDYDIGGGKNFFFFNNPATAKWEMKNWDLDLTWTTTYGGFGETDAWSADVLAIPNLARDHRNRMRELRDLLLNPEQTGMVLDEIARFVHTPGQPSYVDADRAMWDYNPILTSGYVNPSKAGHGRFYQAATPKTFAGMLALQKNYIATRASFIDSSILTDEAQVPAEPTLTYTGLSGFPANGISAQSSNFSSPSGSAFAAMQWRLASFTNVNDPLFDPAQPCKYEIETDWATGDISPFAAAIEVPAVAVRPGLTYRLRVRHKDTAGRWGHWSAPIQFVAGVPDVTQYQQNLMITEIMYNPPVPNASESLVSIIKDDFEYIELSNIGATQLDLTGVRFTKGVNFDIAPGTTLDPGAFALIVKNIPAFQARYGTGLPILGTYGGDNLANSGEQLKLSLGLGTAIHDFVYSDAPPWPVAVDGAGASLVLADPSSAPNHALPASWRASYGHGSPGRSDGTDFSAWSETNNVTGGPGGDDDNDGTRNDLEFFLLGNPHLSDTDILPRPDVQAIEVNGNVDDYLTLTFRYQPAAVGIESFVEFTDNLTDWPNMASFLVTSTANPDGTVTATWRAATPLSLPRPRPLFGRLRVVTQP